MRFVKILFQISLVSIISLSSALATESVSVYPVNDVTAKQGDTINLTYRFKTKALSQNYNLAVHFDKIQSSYYRIPNKDIMNYEMPTQTKNWDGRNSINGYDTLDYTYTIPSNTQEGDYAINIGFYTSDGKNFYGASTYGDTIVPVGGTTLLSDGRVTIGHLKVVAKIPNTSNTNSNTTNTPVNTSSQVNNTNRNTNSYTNNTSATQTNKNQIQAQHSKLCLTSNDNKQVVQDNCINGIYFEKVTSSNSSKFNLRVISKNKCLNVTDTLNGSLVTLLDCNSNLNQLYTQINNSDGSKSYLSTLSGKCLDINIDNTLGKGAELTQWECWGGENQKFKVNLNIVVINPATTTTPVTPVTPVTPTTTATTTIPLTPVTPTPTTTPPVNTSNLISNPSVEIISGIDTTLPESWKKTLTGVNGIAFNYLNTGHTGNHSIEIRSSSYTNGVAYYAFNRVPVQGGQTYEYSFYQKSNIQTELDAEIELSNGDVVYKYLGTSAPSANWTKTASSLTVPDDAVKVTIFNVVSSAGFIVADDFSLSKTTQVPLNRPIVTFTFDDNFANWYTYVFPLFKQNAIAGTLYLVKDGVDASPLMSANMLKEMMTIGFEIGSHTVNHYHLPSLNEVDLNYELTQAKVDITDLVGIAPKNFATPYGEYNDSVIATIRNLYRSHRSVDDGYNGKNNFDIMNIKTKSVTINTTPSEILSWVDKAINDKSWLVLVYHDVSLNGDTYSTTPTQLQQVVNGIKSRGVTVKTIDEALDEIVPQI